MKTITLNLAVFGFLFNSFFLQAQTNESVKNNDTTSLVIFLILLLLYIIPIIDVLKSRFQSGIDKLIWLAALIFVPFLGLLLYLLIGLKQKDKYK